MFEKKENPGWNRGGGKDDRIIISRNSSNVKPTHPQRAANRGKILRKACLGCGRQFRAKALNEGWIGDILDTMFCSECQTGEGVDHD